MLQHVVVCCSKLLSASCFPVTVLQRVAACCSVLRRAVVCCTEVLVASYCEHQLTRVLNAGVEHRQVITLRICLYIYMHMHLYTYVPHIYMYLNVCATDNHIKYELAHFLDARRRANRHENTSMNLCTTHIHICLHAYMPQVIISNISSLISSMRGAEHIAIENCDAVIEFLRGHDCPKSLEKRVASFYRYKGNKHHMLDIEDMTCDMPVTLRNDVKFELVYIYM